MRDRGRVLCVGLGWLLLYGLAVAMVRDFHPTWTVNALATFCLLGSFAMAIGIDLRWLRSIEGIWIYLGSLLAVEVILTLIVVAAIQGVYDLFWHPDPRRFGFWTNFGTDFLGMNLFVGAASCIARVSRWKWSRGASARSIEVSTGSRSHHGSCRGPGRQPDGHESPAGSTPEAG